jgi:hypothetical protein
VIGCVIVGVVALDDATAIGAFCGSVVAPTCDFENKIDTW